MQMFFYLDSYIENIKNIQEIANHKPGLCIRKSA